MLILRFQTLGKFAALSPIRYSCFSNICCWLRDSWVIASFPPTREVILSVSKIIKSPRNSHNYRYYTSSRIELSLTKNPAGEYVTLPDSCLRSTTFWESKGRVEVVGGGEEWLVGIGR